MVATVVAAVHGGFISFADNKLSLLAEIAELADEIDVQRAERALERAKAEARRLRRASRGRPTACGGGALNPARHRMLYLSRGQDWSFSGPGRG